MQDFTTGYGLSGPPRHVPALLKLHLLFGGAISQFGWIFFGFGLIFVWTFTLNADLTSWYVFSGDLQTVQGTITASSKTNMSINETPVYSYNYHFEFDGAQYSGTCYQTGGGLKDNQTVTIEFPQGNPATSRIKGMLRGMGGLFGLMPILFPVVGLCFIIAALRRGIKANRLLRDGDLAQGKLISKERTNTKINDQTVYKLTFEFTASDGMIHQAIAKNHITKQLEDEDTESLLYDPMRPECAVLLDNLPGRPRIDSMGQVSATAGLAVASLLLPFIVIAGHTIYWCMRLTQ